jgi:hypothetical protein
LNIGLAEMQVIMGTTSGLLQSLDIFINLAIKKDGRSLQSFMILAGSIRSKRSCKPTQTILMAASLKSGKVALFGTTEMPRWSTVTCLFTTSTARLRR